MLRFLLVPLVLLMAAACSSPNDIPLPVIHADDPIRPMVPDHLEYGALPL